MACGVRATQARTNSRSADRSHLRQDETEKERERETRTTARTRQRREQRTTNTNTFCSSSSSKGKNHVVCTTWRSKRLTHAQERTTSERSARTMVIHIPQQQQQQQQCNQTKQPTIALARSLALPPNNTRTTVAENINTTGAGAGAGGRDNIEFGWCRLRIMVGAAGGAGLLEERVLEVLD